MPLPTLPIGTIRAPAAAYRREAIAGLLQDLDGCPFTGYLSISSGDRLFLLFLFRGNPYAAGLCLAEKQLPLTITNFCAQVAALRDGTGSISLHETDPVLLKCLLVFMQDEPAARGPVALINLEGMVRQIHEQAADALIVLERNRCCNFFFFLDGTKTAAYWAEEPGADLAELPVDQQMLHYAFREHDLPVTAMIYQSMHTMESGDSAHLSREGLVRLFTGVEQPDVPMNASIPDAEPGTPRLTLRALEGPQADAVFSVTLPCVLGRKDADLIINDPMVSKRHAALQIINGRLQLIDLHSTNGTTLNGDPVSQRELQQGDRIGLGQTLLLAELVSLS